MTKDPETTQDFLAHYLGQLDERQQKAVLAVVESVDNSRCPKSHRWLPEVMYRVAELITAETNGSSKDSREACADLAALCIHKISTLPQP